ncbi:MAG: hypothetical protein J5722_01235 [Oscillospiraceae bacterium]|nr:hypothetical protein [Oscillospiraceae bacterium]
MKTVKRFFIWLAAMLTVILIADAAGGTLLYFAGKKSLTGAMSGYAKKMTFPLAEPQNEDDEKKNGGVLMVRSALSDYTEEVRTGLVGNFTFSNCKFDVADIVLNREGRHALSTGIFAMVYSDYGESGDWVRHCFGLIRVNELVQMPEAAALADALKQYPDSLLRLDAYKIENNKVTPVSVTLTDESGAALQTVTFAADGDVIRADNCYIYNKDATPEDAENANALLWKLQCARAGERPADRLAQKYEEKLPVGTDSYENDSVHFGICSLAFVHSEIIDGNAFVSVEQFTYTKGVIFYSIILGTIVTAALLIVWIMRSQKADY